MLPVTLLSKVTSRVGVVLGLKRIFWCVDGVCEELARADDRKICDHLDSGILKYLQYNEVLTN